MIERTMRVMSALRDVRVNVQARMRGLMTKINDYFSRLNAAQPRNVTESLNYSSSVRIPSYHRMYDNTGSFTGRTGECNFHSRKFRDARIKLCPRRDIFPRHRPLSTSARFIPMRSRT